MSCGYCQAKVLVPDMRVVHQLADEFLASLPPEARTPHARGAAVAQILASGGAAARRHAPGWDDDDEDDSFGTTDSVAVAMDPQLGPIVVRVHAPVGTPPVLQAYDLVQKRVLWEAFKGQTWIQNLEASSYRIHGRCLYLANKRNLVSLDLASGNQKWGAQLPDEIARGQTFGEEPRLVVEDAFPPNQPGAILVKTDDHVLSAFDRDSGRPLYQRTFGKDSSDFDLQVVPNGQAAVVVYGSPYNKCEIINPAYAQPLSRHGEGADGDWSTDLGACTLFGRTVVTRVESFGPETDLDGALCFDVLTGQRHFFVQTDDLEEDIVPETAGGRVFFGVNSGEGMWIGPEGRTYPSPAQGFRISAWKACGPTLFVLLVKARGTEVRRVIGMDPASLAMRFDCGLIGTEPSNLGRETFQSDGQTVVYVASPEDDSSACEVVAVDAAHGNRLWAKPIGDYVSHHVAFGHVIVRSEEKIFVLSVRQGQELASYP